MLFLTMPKVEGLLSIKLLMEQLKISRFVPNSEQMIYQMFLGGQVMITETMVNPHSLLQGLSPMIMTTMSQLQTAVIITKRYL